MSARNSGAQGEEAQERGPQVNGAPARPRPPVSLARRRRARARTLLLTRLGWGVLLLAVLAYTLYQPGAWPQKLGLWVLLTLLADEAGGWFGYLGVLSGGLPFVARHAPPEQWWVILPLVSGALIAALVVKHSGGVLVLPFAFGVFALPLLLASSLAASLDTTLTLPGNGTFRRTALTAAAAALVFSAVRQLSGLHLRRRLEQPRGVAVPATVDPAALE